MDDLEGHLSRKTEESEELRRHAWELEKHLGDLETKVGQLQSDLKVSQGDVAGLKEANGRQSEVISSIKEDLASKAAEADHLDRALAECRWVEVCGRLAKRH